MRAVIFTDVSSATSRLLTQATMAEASRRDGFDVVGFVTTNPEELMPSRASKARSKSRRAIKVMTGNRSGGPGFNLDRYSRKVGLPVLVPDGSVNDQAFIDRIHAELQADVLLSYFFTRILKKPILDSFAQAVNYHDGLLPHFGGLAATSHSVYEQVVESGYTFHRMTPEIDAGALLLQGTVPAGPMADGGKVGRAKAEAAALQVPQVIDMIEANEPGLEQAGEGSYYAWTAWLEVTTIEDPGSIEREDLERRIRAFGSVAITIDGASETVTEVAEASPGDPFSFACADGHLRASRLAGFPAGMIGFRRRLRRSKPVSEGEGREQGGDATCSEADPDAASPTRGSTY